MEVPAANEREAGEGVEDGRTGDGCYVAATGVDELSVLFAGARLGAHAEDSVLALDEDGLSFRDIVGHESGDADPEVDVVAVFELGGDSFCDHFTFCLAIHLLLHALGAFYDVVDEDPWCVYIFGCDLARLHDLVHLNDGHFAGHGHGGV